MKKIIFFCLFAFTALTISAQQEQYSKVRVHLEGKEISQIFGLGVGLEGVSSKTDEYIEVQLSQTEIEKLSQNGFNVEVLISDMTAFYLDRFEKEISSPSFRDLSDLYPVPENWEYGSMGGFYTYDQVLSKLDFMAAQWPNLITVKQPISDMYVSHEGRPIWYVKISDNPTIQEGEPQVLYTSLLHAREGIGVQQMFYFMLHLLENYDTNDEIKYLVDNTEMVFVPVANPDGYVYNQTTNPNGGGMWRKNRRENGFNSYGVDVNRNFGYFWGYDDEGSSGNPDDLTYRGPSAFSEPETMAIKTLTEQHDFKIALNYHSYSDLLLYPWGYTSDLCPDNEIFYVHASMMTRDNNYVYGPSSTTIYPTNGASDDWMYGDTQTKNKIFAYTPECGDGNDGFWPAQARIIPLCQENMIQNILAAYLAGSYGKLTETSPYIIGETSTKAHFDLQRVGFADTQGWVVSVEALDENIIETGDPISFGSLDMLEVVSDSISIILNPEILSGTAFRYVLKLDNGSFEQTDTITKIFGQPTIIFEDPCSNLSKWTSPKWNVTTEDFVSPFSSITDSPGSNYNNNENNIITLNNPIEIGETPYAQLSFWARWNIESGYDYVQLQARKEGTTNWVPLEGKYTKSGSENQDQGKPLYDGISDWVKEEIDLSDYAGESIKLRFRLISDVFVTGEGFYFDDIQLVVIDEETSLNELGHAGKLHAQISPNPANLQTVIQFGSLHNGLNLSIIDMQGKVVYQNLVPAGTREIQLDLNSWNKGVYIVNLTNGNDLKQLKLIVQ